MRSSMNFTSKEVALTIENLDEMQPVAHALSTRLRLQILRLIAESGMGVNEIAHALDVPVSTAALNIQVLERAGLIVCDAQPGVRGTLKLCNRRIDKLVINLMPRPHEELLTRSFEMPVGGFTHAGGIRPTCGFVCADGPNYLDDTPEAFYYPMRFQAELIWMREGYVEYSFPIPDRGPERLEYVELSFEACSEAVGYQNNWPSDIFVNINDREIGVWHCPGDFGGRRGRFNPDWWVDSNTQYGQLKTWRVNRRASMLEGHIVSAVTLEDLKLCGGERVTVRIGTKKSGGYSGGLNLFGKGFGDYPQDIILRYVYRS